MNIKTLFLLVSLVSLSEQSELRATSELVSQADLPEPYQNVQLLPFDPHGWYGNAIPMENLFETNEIKIVIEVGSWLGASTRHIATLLPEDGKIYAVDHWMGSIEHQPGGDAFHPAVSFAYQQFLSNVIHA